MEAQDAGKLVKFVTRWLWQWPLLLHFFLLLIILYIASSCPWIDTWPCLCPPTYTYLSLILFIILFSWTYSSFSPMILAFRPKHFLLIPMRIIYKLINISSSTHFPFPSIVNTLHMHTLQKIHRLWVGLWLYTTFTFRVRFFSGPRAA